MIRVFLQRNAHASTLEPIFNEGRVLVRVNVYWWMLQ